MLVILIFIGLVAIIGSIFFIGHFLGYREGFDDGLLEAAFADDDYNGE